MRRRLAAVAAVTSAFVLFAAAPAFADHETPKLVPDNPTCKSLGLVALFPKVDPPTDVVNKFVTADLSEDKKFLDVVAKEGFVITAVIVKAGPDANVYSVEPFHDMHAPLVGQDKNIPVISHYEVCGGVEETPTPTPTEPTPTETSPTVQPTASESPAVVPTAVPAGADNGGSGTAGLMGLVLAGGVAVAGAAAAVRRRTRHGA